VVLWVNAEKGVDMDISFSDIAVKLGLNGAELHGDPLKTRLLVARWLQKAGKSAPFWVCTAVLTFIFHGPDYDWLIIFDNVEDPGDLQSSWPTGSRGSVLVTSRMELPYGPIEGGTVLPPFSVEEGSKCLIKIVYRDTCSNEERESAEAFSEELGGLPLALALMGTKIRRLSKTVTKSLNQYRQNPSTGPFNRARKATQRNPYYPKKWEKALDEVFSGFNDEEGFEEITALLGTLSCLAAQDVSATFFQPKDTDQLPPSLHFCHNEDE
jgi:hypothetical protein